MTKDREYGEEQVDQDQERREPEHDTDPGEALKRPEPPDRDAVEQHRDEGDGPFGANMQHMRGGTRSPQDNPDLPHAASPYSTGTDATSGTSVTPQDTRSTFAGRGTSGADESEAPGDERP
ncbi:hypothetical protein [Deinococcus sp. YIM 77859]|uniref:hypothetical protein n=1 Tax=Deinococcus sp. YIM 77859 TaxID=1540221 RepID=UPI000A645F16|nr:hypothetical protein [Deinococcus sp. YIM 77859]